MNKKAPARTAKSSKGTTRKSASASKPSESLLAGLKKAGVTPAQVERFAEVGGKPVYRIKTDGTKAIALWGKLRAVVDKTGC